MKKYEAIVFDFGNIFMKLDYERCFSNFSRILNTPFNWDTIPPSLMDHLILHETGKSKNEDLILAFQQMFPSSKSEEIVEAWNSLLVGMKAHHVPFLINLRKEYKLFLLSNINPLHEEWIDAYMQRVHNIGDFKREYFDDFYYTHYIGMRKPDQEIYEFVTEEMKNKDITSFLFIDDMEKNVVAAKAAGWNAVQHDPEDDIKEKIWGYLQ